MDHSTAVLDDSRETVEGAAASSKAETTDKVDYAAERAQHSDDRSRKRKGDWPSDRQQFGSRGGSRGGRGGRGDSKRHKKGDLGRGEYLYVSHTKMHIDGDSLAD